MPDRYTYPGTEVLINSLDVRDSSQAWLVESIWVAGRESQVLALKGPFDETRLKATHKAHFGGFYAWAGQFRTEGAMFKERASGQVVQYGPSANVPGYLANVFSQLRSEKYLAGLGKEQIASRLAYFYSELDAAHPFRDGNSRTIRQFVADLSRSAGYRLDWSRASATAQDIEAIFAARDAAVMRGDVAPLTAILNTYIRSLAG